jgi:hypothetical protein
MSAPASDSPPSPGAVTFAADIRPLFREKDRDSMRGAFDLLDHDDVVAHAAAIGAKLHDGTMPCDGAWPAKQVEVFDRWVDQGFPA